MSLHRTAFLLDMLQRIDNPKDARDVKQAAACIVPAVIRSMGMCIPSPEAWRALVALCAKALIDLYESR